VQTSTFKVQLALDPCEPPSILAANINKVAEFDFTLRGHDDASFSFAKIVYEPSHCTPVSVSVVTDTDLSAVGGLDDVNGYSYDTLYNAAFVMASTTTTNALTVKYTYPLENKGKWVWVVKGKTDVSNAVIEAAGA